MRAYRDLGCVERQGEWQEIHVKLDAGGKVYRPDDPVRPLPDRQRKGTLRTACAGQRKAGRHPEVVHHHGGACILPYFADGTICMVRQFRYAMQQELWELPAGKLEQGEDPFEAAKRELEEECGLTADHYTSLGEFYPTVGYDTEIIYTWVATGLHETHMHLDADEFLTPDRVPLEKAYEMVMRGEIKDGKTIAGILKLKALLNEGKL